MIQPMHDRLLVKREYEKPKGLILAPDIAAKFDQYVRVLAIGPKVREVKVGDILALPGCALNEPDKIMPDGTIFVREEDGGFVIRG